MGTPFKKHCSYKGFEIFKKYIASMLQPAYVIFKDGIQFSVIQLYSVQGAKNIIDTYLERIKEKENEKLK